MLEGREEDHAEDDVEAEEIGEEEEVSCAPGRGRIGMGRADSSVWASSSSSASPLSSYSSERDAGELASETGASGGDEADANDNDADEIEATGEPGGEGESDSVEIVARVTSAFRLADEVEPFTASSDKGTLLQKAFHSVSLATRKQKQHPRLPSFDAVVVMLCVAS